MGLVRYTEFQTLPEHWIWFASEMSAGKRRKSADPDQADIGRTIHGHFTLGPSTLQVMVNSEVRATRVQDLLANSLDGLVTAPLVERVTPEQAMAARGNPSSSLPQSLPEGMSAEDRREVTQQVLDRRYRNILSKKIAMLGDKTARQAVRSAKGRQAVANGLKGFDQNNARLPQDNPMHGYDFSWMWEELGITDLRP